MGRKLTNLEGHMLQPIFKDTLRYGEIVCKINEANIGGASNSITPAGVAYFSKQVYCSDFSKANAGDKWVFVHEMMHVWQWGHAFYPVHAAIGLFLQTAADYANAYPYDLATEKNLIDFNIEQQASVVADYWALANNLAPLNNKNKKATVSDYGAFIDQLQKSGPSVKKLDQVPF
jgi:hypothetical protein